MSVFGDFAEIIFEVIGDFLIEYIIKPVFKNIGASIRWLSFLGKKSYGEILLKNHNTLLGFIIILISIIATVYFHFN